MWWSVRPSDRDPGLLAWLLGAISLGLPFVAVPLIAYGLWWLANGDRSGGLYLALGLALLVLDFLIDFVWARTMGNASDEPALNNRGHHFVGRTALVTEPIVDGRGRVRIGDGQWLAEGPDLPAGASVVVLGVNGTTLQVGPPTRAKPGEMN